MKLIHQFTAHFFKNAQSRTITKNTGWLFIGQITSRIFRATIVIYAARILGAESWGAFSYALGVATFLTVFSDIGINALITKEAVRNPELKNQYIATAFFTKLGLALILFLGVMVFLPRLTNIEEALYIMPLLIFVFVFDTLRDLGSAVARAMEKMHIEAIIHIFTNAMIAVLGFIFLARAGTSQSLALAYVLGSGMGLVAILYTLRSQFKNLFRNVTLKLIKPIIATAWPFGLLGLMGIIMLNTDIIMLGWLTSASELGYYSASQKIIQLLYILPTLLAVSAFPSMARAARENPEHVKEFLEKAVSFIILLSIPITIIGIIFAKSIIVLLFGNEYVPSVTVFKLLMLTIIIVFPSSFIGNAIFAYDKQKNFIVFVVTATIANIGLNFLFIPLWGIEGAAFSTIVTQLIVNTLMWRKMKKINGFTVWSSLKKYLTLPFSSGV